MFSSKHSTYEGNNNDKYFSKLCLPLFKLFLNVVVVDVDVVVVVEVDILVVVKVVVVVEVDVDIKIVVSVVVVVVVVVVDGCISSTLDRHVVTMSSSLMSPPPVLTSHPLHCDRGHRTYLSCSLTRSPL